MTEALKPCPLCGNPPGTKVGPPELAKCLTQGCEGSKLAAETFAGWNTRATTAAAQPDRCPHSIRRSMCTVCRDAAQPVAWQMRTHFIFDGNEGWTDWEPATQETAQRIKKNGKYGMHRAEVRALYASLPASQPDGVREDCSPLPWKIIRGEIIAADGEAVGTIFRTEAWSDGDVVESEDQANAALISKAVNAALSRPAVDGDGREAIERTELNFARTLNEVLCEIIEAGTSESREIASRVTTHPKIKEWLGGLAHTRPERGGSK